MKNSFAKLSYNELVAKRDELRKSYLSEHENGEGPRPRRQSSSDKKRQKTDCKAEHHHP